MPRHIAFLRAINVGGHVVKMDHLRSLLTSFGFTNVETFIASGNAIFDAKTRSTAKVEDQIEEGLLASLGYEVVTFVRTPAELEAIAAHRPFVEEPSVVGFLKRPPADAAVKKTTVEWPLGAEEVTVQGRELYWRHGGRMSDSTLTGVMIERALGPATLRNLNTVAKIAAKYPA